MQVVGEGALKPVGSMSFALPVDKPQQAVGGVVMSRELLKTTHPTWLAAMTQSLRVASAASVDARVVADLTSGTAVSEETASRQTVGALLGALDGARRPVLIGGWTELAPVLDMLPGLRALGVTVLANPAAVGKLIALDAEGLLLRDRGVEVTVATQATIAMTTSGSPEGTELVRLWQQNLALILAERFFNCHHRADAVVWSDVMSGSPA